MGKRFIVTHVGNDGEAILADGAAANELAGVVLNDVLASDTLGELPPEDRDAVFNAAVALNGLSCPPFPEQVTIYDRVYRVEELPDVGAALDEFLADRLGSPNLLRLVIRLPGKLRYEIWPNESQHRGRPHCKVSYSGQSATFSIPDGVLLAGHLRPHEAEAAKSIRLHGKALMDKWQLMRPDDQRIIRP